MTLLITLINAALHKMESTYNQIYLLLSLLITVKK
jgi:hypothetical protein